MKTKNQVKDLIITRKINLLFFLFILLFSQIAGYLSIAAFSSLTQIIKRMKIPSGLIDLNLDIYHPEEIKVSIPYYIQNHGIYDLNDLFMEVEISVNYIDIFSRKNITAQIFSKDEALPDCRAFNTILGYFNG
ncbi:hypothetical protein LCGC14_0493100, partial [marine sediment metagenome]